MSDDPLASLRQQYHFRPDPDSAGDGKLAWDVFRLIELSRDLAIEDLPLESLTAEIDSVYWFDADTHRPTIRAVIEHMALIRSADLSYPIILGAGGEVMDGMHRVARAVMEGRDTIPARRFPVDPEPDHRDCQPADLPYDR